MVVPPPSLFLSFYLLLNFPTLTFSISGDDFADTPFTFVNDFTNNYEVLPMSADNDDRVVLVVSERDANEIDWFESSDYSNRASAWDDHTVTNSGQRIKSTESAGESRIGEKVGNRKQCNVSNN